MPDQRYCDCCGRPVSLEDGVIGVAPPDDELPVVILGAKHSRCLEEWEVRLDDDGTPYHFHLPEESDDDIAAV